MNDGQRTQPHRAEATGHYNEYLELAEGVSWMLHGIKEGMASLQQSSPWQ